MAASKTKNPVCEDTDPNCLDTILRSMLHTGMITSDLEDISVLEFFERLQSDDFCKITLLIGLALAKMLNKIANFNAFVDTLHSQSSPGIAEALRKQRKRFINRNEITEEDKFLLTLLLEGVPLKQFEDAANLKFSTARRKIKGLCDRLGVKNRAQLLYVTGRMELIPFEAECLRFEEVE
jgi:hypothetical protein